jgi:hypothetical protein
MIALYTGFVYYILSVKADQRKKILRKYENLTTGEVFLIPDGWRNSRG